MRRRATGTAAPRSAGALRGAAAAGLAAAVLVVGTATPASVAAQAAVRARDLGVPFDGAPGPLNAITDVAGVAVGHTTLISGSGPLVVGEGPVRTGVTAILPRGAPGDPVFGAYYSLNGNGELTGAAWIEESGFLEGPVLITNTHSVGVVRDATIGWLRDNQAEFFWALPVVAETYDGTLNDIDGFHVRPEHAHAALDAATGGPVVEGAVGGGTGMSCNGFKGGIGTSSRRLEAGHTVGVLVQCNYGSQDGFLLAGVPVGRELATEGFVGRCRSGDVEPTRAWIRDMARCDDPAGRPDDSELGSIIVVVATDAPLLPHQLERLLRRVALGLGRLGSISSNFSGDLFVAFSTGNGGLAGAAEGAGAPLDVRMLPNGSLDPLFRATVQATEEAVVNAMVAAETMTGADGVTLRALPPDRTREILRRYGRLAGQGG